MSTNIKISKLLVLSMVTCLIRGEVVEIECPNLPPPKFIDERQMVNVHQNGKKDWFCCQCPSGTRRESWCDEDNPSSTICVPCEGDSYMEEEMHTNRECTLPNITKFDCDDTKFEQFIRGDSKHGPSCHCKSGYFRSEGRCVPFQQCPQNYEIGTEGTPFTNRTCRPCLAGYESEGGSDRCKPKKFAKEGTTVGETKSTTQLMVSTQDLSSSDDATQKSPDAAVTTRYSHTSSNNTSWIVPLFVLVFILIILVIIFVLFYKKRLIVLACSCKKDDKEPIDGELGSYSSVNSKSEVPLLTVSTHPPQPIDEEPGSNPSNSKSKEPLLTPQGEKPLLSTHPPQAPRKTNREEAVYKVNEIQQKSSQSKKDSRKRAFSENSPFFHQGNFSDDISITEQQTQTFTHTHGGSANQLVKATGFTPIDGTIVEEPSQTVAECAQPSNLQSNLTHSRKCVAFFKTENAKMTNEQLQKLGRSCNLSTADIDELAKHNPSEFRIRLIEKVSQREASNFNEQYVVKKLRSAELNSICCHFQNYMKPSFAI